MRVSLKTKIIGLLLGLALAPILIEEGRAAVFVGSAHMLQLRDMLAEDGFTVRQAYQIGRASCRERV